MFDNSNQSMDIVSIVSSVIQCHSALPERLSLILSSLGNITERESAVYFFLISWRYWRNTVEQVRTLWQFLPLLSVLLCKSVNHRCYYSSCFKVL